MKLRFTKIDDTADLTFNQLLGINDKGYTVGFYTDTTGANHGFTYNELTDKYTTIDQGNRTMTVINGLNDQNELVGFYVDRHNHTNGLRVHVTPDHASAWARHGADNRRRAEPAISRDRATISHTVVSRGSRVTHVTGSGTPAGQGALVIRRSPAPAEVPKPAGARQ